jgi:hypothetical protein
MSVDGRIKAGVHEEERVKSQLVGIVVLSRLVLSHG